MVGVALRFALVALLVYRTARDSMMVRRGLLPATRLVLPVLILMLAVLVANRAIPRVVSGIMMFAVDVCVLGIGVAMMRGRTSEDRALPLEERLEAVFSRFFPTGLARFMAIDITVMSSAGAGLRALVRGARPTPTSYVLGSKVPMLGIIVAMSIVPDSLAVALFVPSHLAWVKILLIVLEVWSCLWIFGLYGTMFRRPHHVEGDEVVLHNGILQSMAFGRADVDAVRSRGYIRRGRIPKKERAGAAFMALGGVPVVQIELRCPPRVLKSMLPRIHKEPSLRVFVGSDAPDALCAMLRVDHAIESEPIARRAEGNKRSAV